MWGSGITAAPGPGHRPPGGQRGANNINCHGWSEVARSPSSGPLLAPPRVSESRARDCCRLDNRYSISFDVLYAPYFLTLCRRLAQMIGIEASISLFFNRCLVFHFALCLLKCVSFIFVWRSQRFYSLLMFSFYYIVQRENCLRLVSNY